jgi:hypothetical protein
VRTLWRRDLEGWVATERVLDVAPGGGAYVDALGRLFIDTLGRLAAGKAPVDDRPVDGDVIPGLSVGPDGTVYYARSPRPPETDVWKVAPGGQPQRVTSDGQSDRPVALPDGALLWISAAPDGVAGWVRDGRKITHGLAVPVPAFPRKTRLEGGRVVYDAGDAEWTLDPRTGEAHRR